MLKKLLIGLLLLTAQACWAAVTYNPSNNQLTIPAIYVAGITYNDVVITVGSVIRIDGGSASDSVDYFNPTTNQLFISSVDVNGRTFTNVLISVGQVISVRSGSSAGGSAGVIAPVNPNIVSFMSSNITIEKISRIPINSSPNQTLAVVDVIEAFSDYSLRTRYEIAVDGIFYDKNDPQLNNSVKEKVRLINKSVKGIYKESSIDGLTVNSFPPATIVSKVVSSYDIGNGISRLEEYSGFDVYPLVVSSVGDPVLKSLIEKVIINAQPQYMLNYDGFTVSSMSVSSNWGRSAQQSPTYTLVEACLLRKNTLSIKRCEFVRVAFNTYIPNSYDSDFLPFIRNKLIALGLTS